MRRSRRFSMAEPGAGRLRRARGAVWVAAALVPVLAPGHAEGGPVRADTETLVRAHRAAEARQALAAAKRAFRAGRYDRARPVLEGAPDDPEALLMLARIHDEGLGRAAENAVLAVAYLGEASNRGSAEATYRLARHYAQGRGVRRSREKATALYRKAARNGHAKAAERYQSVLDRKAEPNPGNKPDAAPRPPEEAGEAVSAPNRRELALGGRREVPVRKSPPERPKGDGRIQMRPSELTDFDF